MACISRFAGLFCFYYRITINRCSFPATRFAVAARFLVSLRVGADLRLYCAFHVARIVYERTRVHARAAIFPPAENTLIRVLLSLSVSPPAAATSGYYLGRRR